MTNSSLTGRIPTEIGSLSILRHLYLTGNELKGALPSEVVALAEVRRVLDENGFLNVQLRRVYVDGNNLVSIPEEVSMLMAASRSPSFGMIWISKACRHACKTR